MRQFGVLPIDSIANQRHNQTVGNIAHRSPVLLNEKITRMNKVASPFNVVRQDVPLAHSEILARKLAGVNPVLPDEIIHELRQPLSVIDSLAYYLELTAADEKIYAHLDQIRAMVSQANRILERASDTQPEMPAGSSFFSGS
jgi:signal transduction histidine kinase